MQVKRRNVDHLRPKPEERSIAARSLNSSVSLVRYLQASISGVRLGSEAVVDGVEYVQWKSESVEAGVTRCKRRRKVSSRST